MPNALSFDANPPPPNPQDSAINNALTPQAMKSGAGPMPGAMPQAQQPIPAPNHIQTVAALRHFNAVIGELQKLLSSDELGKADMKSQIIDGVTKLVSQRIIAPATAVTQLGTVPERPFDQKTWLQKMLSDAMNARDAVLAHHAAAYAGQGQMPPGNPDDHMADMTSMMAAHYTPVAGNA